MDRNWLDDLRRDPDGTHRRLVASLYQRPESVVACFCTPSFRRKGFVFVDVPVHTSLVLLPPDTVAGAREIVFRLPGGVRIARDPRSGVRRRHMLAFTLATNGSIGGGQR